MQEKDMVNDALSMINSSLTGYANIIAQAENPQFRQTIQQMRNGDETFQYNLFQEAKKKGYYKPAAPASQGEIQQVKSDFNQS